MPEISWKIGKSLRKDRAIIWNVNGDAILNQTSLKNKVEGR